MGTWKSHQLSGETLKINANWQNANQLNIKCCFLSLPPLLSLFLPPTRKARRLFTASGVGFVIGAANEDYCLTGWIYSTCTRYSIYDILCFLFQAITQSAPCESFQRCRWMAAAAAEVVLAAEATLAPAMVATLAQVYGSIPVAVFGDRAPHRVRQRSNFRATHRPRHSSGHSRDNQTQEDNNNSSSRCLIMRGKHD